MYDVFHAKAIFKKTIFVRKNWDQYVSLYTYDIYTAVQKGVKLDYGYVLAGKDSHFQKP